MPNHFTLCCIAGRDWLKLEENGLDDFPEDMFEELPKTNLCEVSAKLPDELQGIVSSHPPQRYFHKETGEQWVEDCNGPWGAEDREKWEAKPLTDAEQRELINKYGACTWYEWQHENWGTKWGTYHLKVHELGGDGSPIFIECQCAWGPPNPKSMRAITEYLEETYYLKNIKWFGHDPYDGDTCDIEVAEQSIV
jgi:hypothetical protein